MTGNGCRRLVSAEGVGVTAIVPTVPKGFVALSPIRPLLYAANSAAKALGALIVEYDSPTVVVRDAVTLGAAIEA